MESKANGGPAWFGLRYPNFDDLVDYALELGCLWGRANIGENALFIAGGPEPPVILSPISASPLQAMWLMAHELGHLCQHSGPKGELFYSKCEAQANRWAACALIPEARIAKYGNASLDAFIGAISSHYEHLPFFDCPARRLAAKIANIRMDILGVNHGKSSDQVDVRGSRDYVSSGLA